MAGSAGPPLRAIRRRGGGGSGGWRAADHHVGSAPGYAAGYNAHSPVASVVAGGSFPSQHDYTLGLGGLLFDTYNNSLYTPGIAQNVGGTDSFFHTDWLGSTRYLSDSTGNAFPSALRYDAFGNRTDTNTPYGPSLFQFGADWGYQSLFSPGAEQGPGLLYLQQRYYDPWTGRFLSRDRLGVASPLERYAYALNDPVNEVDPGGLQAEGELFEGPEEIAADEAEIADLEARIQAANELAFRELLARHGLTPEVLQTDIIRRFHLPADDPFDFRIPRGFDSAGQFLDFVDRFRNAGGDPFALIGVRGSATTGVSFKTGKPFRPESDIDFFLVSDEVFARAVAAGARPKRGALPVGATKRLPELFDTGEALGKELRRDVSIRIFSRIGYALVRSRSDIVVGR